MRLLLYWRIVKKRFWIILILLCLSLISFLAFAPKQAATFSASMRFVVGIRPEAGGGAYYTYDRYYTWLTAEYLLDDLAEVVKSRRFAQDVATVAGVQVPVGTIQGATSAGKLHRILSIQIIWGNSEELLRLAEAVTTILLESGDLYFAQLSAESAVVSLIDPPQIAVVGPSLRQRIDFPLRLMLSLVAGVALSFLLDYLDQSIRDRRDVEALGIVILAEVPSPSVGWTGRLRNWRSHPMP